MTINYHSREEQATWAMKLQIALNNGEYNGDYTIRYDMGDSGMTWCYFKGELYKRVHNDEMTGSINVYDYSAPIELLDPIFPKKF